MKKVLISFFMLTGLFCFFAENSSSEKLRAAVLDFSEKGVSKDLTGAISENLITILIDSGVFDVIERSQLKKVMDELSLQNSDDFNDNLRKNLGNLYGVEIVLLGSVTKIGRKFTVNVRGVEVETGIAKFAKSFTTEDVDEIPELLEELVYYGIIKGVYDIRKKPVKESPVLIKKEKKVEKKPDPANYNKKFYPSYMAMRISSYVLIPLTCISLPLAFLFLGLQYGFASTNNNTSSMLYGTYSMEQLNTYAEYATNFQAARNVFLIIGCIALPSGIVAGALSLYFKKRYMGLAQNKKEKKEQFVFFDVGFAGDNVSLEAKIHF